MAILSLSGDNTTQTKEKTETEELTKCKTQKGCPPCRTIAGRVVPVGTTGYRPLDIIPDDKMEHGVYGSHHNIFIANQAPLTVQNPASVFGQSKITY